jgi:hypothetical protein
MPLRDTTRTRQLPRGLPRPSLRSVRRLSQPLDGFLRARACGLISSRSHVQAHPVQGVLFSHSHLSSSERVCPRAVVSVRAHRPKSAATRPDPRLRGFYLCEDTFQQFSYSPLRRPFPSSSFSPPGFLFSRRVPQFTRGTPLMVLRCSAFACALALHHHLQRILHEKTGLFVSKPPTCSSFRTFCPFVV